MKKLTELRSKVSELKKEKNALETTIDDILKKLEEYVKLLPENYEKATKTIIQRSDAKIKKITSSFNKTLSEAVNKAESKLDELRKHVETLEDEIKKLTTKAVEVGETIGKYEGIKPILNLMATGKGAPNEIMPSMLVLLERFRTWIMQTHPPSMSYTTELNLNSLIEDLRRYLKP